MKTSAIFDNDLADICYHTGMIGVEFQAMGSKIRILLDLPDGRANPTGERACREALRRARGWFKDWEMVFSRFLPESELSQLNSKVGEPTRVSRELWEVLEFAFKAYLDTQGLVTPAILPALERAGYDRPFHEITRSGQSIVGKPISGESDPGDARYRPVDPIPEWAEVAIDAQERIISLPKNIRIDLGGYVKGWAADEAARRLGNLAPVLVEAGGDVSVRGSKLDESAWLVEVGLPTSLKQDGACGVQGSLLRIGSPEFPLPCGVAASGSLARRWGMEGRFLHHLIDPRSGQPAKSDLVQVAIVARCAIHAEIAAKAVFLMGCEEGEAWLSERGLKGVLWLDSGGVRNVGFEMERG